MKPTLTSPLYHDPLTLNKRPAACLATRSSIWSAPAQPLHQNRVCAPRPRLTGVTQPCRRSTFRVTPMNTTQKSSWLTKEAGEAQREWFQIDATGLTLGRIASRIALVLRGKHKATYTPNV